MKYRESKLGSISEVGLGCWQIGGADWGDVSEEAAFEVMQSAMVSGTNFFDTADVYGLGRSEELIGKFIKSSGSSAGVIVATKIGRFPEPGWPGNFSKDSIRTHVVASLKRLQTNCLDLVQLHCIPTKELRRGDVFDYLQELKVEGLIKQFGVSVESVEEGMICLECPWVASLQVIYNIFRQLPEEQLFPKALARDVAIIVRLPLASGLLAGRYTRNTTFPESDHRNYNRDGNAFNVGETFAGLPFEKGVDAVDKIRSIVPESLTMAQFALRWCLDNPAVTTIIPGARNAAMAHDNAVVSNLKPLSAEVHEQLRTLYTEEVLSHIRGPY